MNNAGPKEKYFKVQLQHGLLTSEASLAARSLFVFRQMGKLYQSVHHLAEHGPALAAEARRAIMSKKKSGSKTPLIQYKHKKKRKFNSLFGAELEEAILGQGDVDDEPGVEKTLSEKKGRNKMSAEHKADDILERSKLSLAEDLAHQQKMEDLEEKVCS